MELDGLKYGRISVILMVGGIIGRSFQGLVTEMTWTDIHNKHENDLGVFGLNLGVFSGQGVKAKGTFGNVEIVVRHTDA